jgi:anti-sigma factor RsiW
MTDKWCCGGEPPSPEQLAAFADGELCGAEARRVAAWLALHPDARDEVEWLRRLDGLCASAAPREPCAAAWARTFARLQKALPCKARSKRRRPYLIGFASVAAAAATLFVVMGRGPRPVAPTSADDSFVVAEGQDVTFVRMDAADASALVVGRPPADGDFELARLGDVNVLRVEPREDGQWGDWRPDGEAPMFVPTNSDH